MTVLLSVQDLAKAYEADGRTRVLGYTRDVGDGSVAYIALGHCHNPAIRAGRAADPTDTTPLTFHGSWESPAFTTLLRNAIAWGVGAQWGLGCKEQAGSLIERR